MSEPLVLDEAACERLKGMILKLTVVMVAAEAFLDQRTRENERALRRALAALDEMVVAA